MQYKPEAWQLRRSVLGGLNTILLHPSKSVPETVVVLCHGYGATGTDLVPCFEDILSYLPEDCTKPAFLFPEAPVDLSGNGMYDARAWWELNMAKLMEMSATNSFADMRETVPEGLAEAREALCQCIRECCEQQKCVDATIVLGGFSQGAMLAVDTALRGSVAKVGGLLVYSGALICESQWRAAAKNRPLSVPLVQTHGRQDQVLPIATGRWLSELLQDIGCQGNLFEFNGPHTIPTEALVSTAKLLTNLGGRSQ